MQAAYFRRVLAERRAHLDSGAGQVQHQIERAREAGDRFETHRLLRLLREQEDELRHLDWLVAGLDHRFSEA
jgi:hypothetical protein